MSRDIVALLVLPLVVPAWVEGEGSASARG